MPNRTLPRIMSTTHFKYDVFSLENSKTLKTVDKPCEFELVNLNSDGIRNILLVDSLRRDEMGPVFTQGPMLVPLFLVKQRIEIQMYYIAPLFSKMLRLLFEYKKIQECWSSTYILRNKTSQIKSFNNLQIWLKFERKIYVR